MQCSITNTYDTREKKIHHFIYEIKMQFCLQLCVYACAPRKRVAWSLHGKEIKESLKVKSKMKPYCVGVAYSYTHTTKSFSCLQLFYSFYGTKWLYLTFQCHTRLTCHVKKLNIFPYVCVRWDIYNQLLIMCDTYTVRIPLTYHSISVVYSFHFHRHIQRLFIALHWIGMSWNISIIKFFLYFIYNAYIHKK